MGFVSQICRVMHSAEDKNHWSLKVDSEWQSIRENYFNAEMQKEDQVLVHDPRQPLDDEDDLIDIPPDFKLSNQFMVSKRNKKADYDSLGQALKLKGPRIVKDADSSSEESSDDEALNKYKFIPKVVNRGGGNMFEPKKMMPQDEDYSGYNSGGFEAKDLLNDEPEHRLKLAGFRKENSDEEADQEPEEVDVYNLVNDWNIYGQGSWRKMSRELRVPVKSDEDNDSDSDSDRPELVRTQSAPVPSLEKLTASKKFKEDEDDEGGLERHSVTPDENRKFGLYDSLTRRFQIKKKKKKKKAPSLDNMYDSVGGQGKASAPR